MERAINVQGAAAAAAWAEFEAQGVLQPGEPGWWKVWGAGFGHVRAGDLFLTRGADGSDEVYLAEDVFEAKAHPIRVGVVIEGERVTWGIMCPLVLLRRGTHNTLREGR